MNGKTACFDLLREALAWFRLFSHFILSKIHPAAITASICVLEWGGERKFYLNRVAAAQFSGLVNLVFSRQTGLCECSHSWINKPTVIAEPTVPSARLLNLGSKLYPNNMQRMLNKDLTRSRVHKKSSKRKKRSIDRMSKIELRPKTGATQWSKVRKQIVSRIFWFFYSNIPLF